MCPAPSRLHRPLYHLRIGTTGSRPRERHWECRGIRSTLRWLKEAEHLIFDDPHRFDHVQIIGVDEHKWKYERGQGAPSFVTIIVDLTPVTGSKARNLAESGCWMLFPGPIQTSVVPVDSTA